MFIIDALFSWVNDLLHINGWLIHHHEYSGTLDSSRYPSFFLLAVWEQARLQWRMWLSQQGQIQWEEYDKEYSYTQSMEEGRCTAARGIITGEWKRKDRGIIIKECLGSSRLPIGHSRDLHTLCVLLCVCMTCRLTWLPGLIFQDAEAVRVKKIEDDDGLGCYSAIIYLLGSIWSIIHQAVNLWFNAFSEDVYDIFSLLCVHVYTVTFRETLAANSLPYFAS